MHSIFYIYHTNVRVLPCRTWIITHTLRMGTGIRVRRVSFVVVVTRFRASRPVARVTLVVITVRVHRPRVQTCAQTDGAFTSVFSTCEIVTLVTLVVIVPVSLCRPRPASPWLCRRSRVAVITMARGYGRRREWDVVTSYWCRRRVTVITLWWHEDWDGDVTGMAMVTSWWHPRHRVIVGVAASSFPSSSSRRGHGGMRIRTGDGDGDGVSSSPCGRHCRCVVVA